MNQNQSSNETYNSLQSQSSIYNLNKFNNQNQIPKPMAIPQGQIQPVQIVINQMAQQNAIYIDTTKIKTKPFGLNCPVCNANIQTFVKKKCNWYSCLLCYCAGICTWITLQCCRNKELNCYNAEHFCPRCGNKIAEYNSC